MKLFPRGVNAQWRCWLACGAVVAILGVMLTATPLGDWFATLSYDLPYLFRGNIQDTNIVVVLEDRASLDALGEKRWPPSRTVHARLVDRLREEGAKLIVFDILFRNEMPGDDEIFATAIRRHGNVILGGIPERLVHQVGALAGTEIVELKPPVSTLRTNAAGWGILLIGNLDTSYGVRRMTTVWRDTQSAIWLAAQRASGDARIGKPKTERWINFYGPSPALDQVTLGQVLQVEGRRLPPGFLRGKTLFVGFDPAVTPASGVRDVFGTPFTRFGHDFAPGVEVLANACANLLRNDWLRRMATPLQSALAVAFGVAAFALLVWVGRNRIWFGAVILLALLLLGSLALQYWSNWWWNWLGMGVVQLPLAFLLAFAYPCGKPVKLSSLETPASVEEFEPGSIFISYAGEDQAAAFAMADALITAGLPVWVDRKLTPGDDFRERILREIRHCSAFVPLLSKHIEHREKGWFRREWKAALDHASEFTGTSRKFLFPVVIDDTPLKKLKPVRDELFGRTTCVAPQGKPPVELVNGLRETVAKWREQEARH